MILPLFVRPGQGIRKPIDSMPGQFQLSVDEFIKEVEEAASLGLGGVLLFGIPETKDAVGSDAMSENGIIAEALRAARGVAGRDNDTTLENLVRQVLVHARAGADMVAPSGMMDGMVRAIRGGLDREGFSHLPIMSYSAKYASSFYGPFRDAAESTPQFGDRRSYQMDPAAASGQALREVELDLNEGADIVMVKPALAYLDIIRQVRDHFVGVPIAAYNVSGEYSMVKAAAEKGWINEKAVVLESLTALTRAGATILISYWAKEAAKWL